MNEQECITEAQSGSQKAFEKLMNNYMKLIYNYLRTQITGEQDILDVLQETMLGIWLAIQNFSGKSSFKTFVFSITKRKIADFYRKKYSLQEIAAEEIPEVFARDEYEGILEKHSVQKAVNCLKASDRELLYLIFEAELSYSEINALTGIPLGSIKSRVFALKNKLKPLLEG